jgi:uncharacterized protein
MVDLKDVGKAKEEQWFNAHEEEMLRKAREKKEHDLRVKREAEEAAESGRLKKLHWMCCPKCGRGMEHKDLSGIEVDECTACGGIYFDHGELEQLLATKVEERKGFLKRLLGA